MGTPRHEADYLQLEVSRLELLMRYLTAGSIHQMPLQADTRQSFEFQWASSPDGNWIDNRPELKSREPGLVLQYTRLPREWFAAKLALDAGCGSGRFSWALERLRRATAGMTFTERYEEMSRINGAEAGGWFDAVSPLINDTYPYYEIQIWLRREGFADIVRTVDQSSHCVVARRI